MVKVLKVISFVFLIGFIAIVAFVFYYFSVTKDVKFDKQVLLSNNQTINLYDNTDKLIKNASLVGSYITIDKLSPHTLDSFIAIEDKRFYSHGAIDAKSLARAFVSNLVSMKNSQGGSTISQQLIKNAFLDNEKTLERKLKEFKLAIALEKNFSKDQILEMYLNTIYFGEGAIGINEASLKYFNVTADRLNLNQSATLAGLINAPTRYNPFNNYSLSMKRKNIVLNEMYSQGKINKADFNNCNGQDVAISYEYKNGINNYTSGVISEMTDILNLGKNNSLNRYNVYTYLNNEIQNDLPQIADYVKIPIDFSFVILDNKTKSIIASSSSCGFISRNIASTAKPILVYAPAIEENIITEATIIRDEKISFGSYSPKNYGDKYHGNVSARYALSNSLNIPAIKLLNSLTTKKALEYAKKLDLDLTDNGLSMALGNLSRDLNLTTLANSYIPLACEGEYSKVKFIKKITDKNGKVIYTNKPSSKKVFSKSTAYIVTDMLKETVKSGTAKSLNSLKLDIACKTGTNGDTNGNRDAYSICYTPAYTVGVWLGKSDNSYMPNSITGGGHSVMIAKDILTKLYKARPIDKFNKPHDVVRLSIDKASYNSDGKLLLAHDSTKASDRIEFNFKADNCPKTIAKDRLDRIKIDSMNIKANKDKIEFFINHASDIYYEIYLKDSFKDKLIFDSKVDSNLVIEKPEKSKKLLYYALPYIETKEGKFYGEKSYFKEVFITHNIINDEWWKD